MRWIQSATTILGGLALAWTLVLAPPGVRAVRAEDGAAKSEVAEGGSCSAGGEVDQHALVDSMQAVQRAKVAQLAASLAEHDPGPEYVDLNNRGYNQPRPGEQPPVR
jgi:hypothetical protein